MKWSEVFVAVGLGLMTLWIYNNFNTDFLTE